MDRIKKIDKQINAIRKELRKREQIDELCYESWQRALDRHPGLRFREKELFRQRGIEQDRREHEAMIDARLMTRALTPG